jgi:Kef-type K+ transport system membrane component KefB
MQIDGTLLLPFGVFLFAVSLGGHVMKRLGIPQVLGFMLTGLFLGVSGLNLITADLEGFFGFITSLALGIIGYNVGNEIDLSSVKKRFRELTPILILESAGTSIIVTTLIFFITGNIPIAIILGSLSAATAPAATAEVVWEYKCKGPLTESLMFILILDDIIAIILVNVMVQIALFVLAPTMIGIGVILFDLIWYIGASVLVGVVSGYLISRFLKKIKYQHVTYLEIMIASLIGIIGFTEFVHLSPLLTTITLGVVIANSATKEERAINHEVEKIMSPFIIFFFAIIGAKINLGLLLSSSYILVIALVYLVGRSIAKYIGVRAGAKIGKAPSVVKKYLGFALLTQAGVAVGLAVEVSRILTQVNPLYADLGLLIINIIGITTMASEIIGPLGVKYALQESGEMEDFIPSGEMGLARDSE